MSNRLNLSATRNNVLRLREELDFALEGHELLEQKREVLVMEVTSLLEKFRKRKKEADEILTKAYRSFEETCLVLGEDGLSRASLAMSSKEEIEVKSRSIMGVTIPRVNYSRKETSGHQCGFQGTSAGLDKTVFLFGLVLEKLAWLAEVEISLRKLAHELKKTQRRANALNYLLIPEYRETVRYLENTLEEKEREEFFQLKLAKVMHGQ